MTTRTPRPPDGSDSPRGLRRRTVLGGALALGTAGLWLPSGTAVAAPGAAPSIAGCDTWGARPPASPVRVVGQRPLKVLVHHTASPNSTDYSREQAFRLARSIQNHHMDTNGWIDSGQHFTISRGGYVMEGRHRSLETLLGGTSIVEGAHSPGQNTFAIGIENEGTYTSVEPTSALYAALVEMCVHICSQYGLRSYQIYGHRDFNNTECPGDLLYAMLPRLRRDVAARIGGDPTAPVWPVVKTGDSGERVRTVQYLLRQHGATLSADGAYGSATANAVEAFQRSVRAVQDGVAGNQSWNQLITVVAQGSSGEAVRAAQSQLVAHGAGIQVDGAFGPNTATAVRNFQSGRSLPVDGVVDARTWGALVA